MNESVRIAYEESRRSLASQEAELVALHARASFILAGGGIGAGVVFGPSRHIEGFGLCAVLAFLAAAVFATAVLFPVFDDWRFTTSATWVLDRVGQGDTEDAIAVSIASDNQRHYNDNFNILKWRYRLFWGACVSLSVAILCAALAILIP